MITYENGILREKNGHIEIEIGFVDFYPSREFKIFDICIENYEDVLLVYYKRYFFEFFYDAVDYPDIKNPEKYCTNQFKTYTKTDFLKRNPREVKYLTDWVQLKKIEEKLLTLYNKNLIIIK